MTTGIPVFCLILVVYVCVVFLFPDLFINISVLRVFRCVLLPQGKRVLVVDDVITAGTAIREAMDILYEAEAVPAGVVIALDRQVVPVASPCHPHYSSVHSS